MHDIKAKVQEIAVLTVAVYESETGALELN
jgi:hypothetical protein